MSILQYRSSELATVRKSISDLKNDTEELTFAGSDSKPSSHGKAARNVREYKDILKLKVLEAKVDSAVYYDEYKIDEVH